MQTIMKMHETTWYNLDLNIQCNQNTKLDYKATKQEKLKGEAKLSKQVIPTVKVNKTSDLNTKHLEHE